MNETVKGLTESNKALPQISQQSPLPKFDIIFGPLIQKLEEQTIAYKQVAHPVSVLK